MVWYSGADMGGATVWAECVTVGRILVWLWKRESLHLNGRGLTLGSALATLIRKISADSGEWLGL